MPVPQDAAAAASVGTEIVSDRLSAAALNSRLRQSAPNTADKPDPGRNACVGTPAPVCFPQFIARRHPCVAMETARLGNPPLGAARGVDGALSVADWLPVRLPSDRGATSRGRAVG